MSVSENMIFLSNAQEFTPGVGEFIALEVALGAGLAELHELHERVPNPIVVNRWARQFPAFGVLMEEAEVAAAQKLAYESKDCADDTNLSAPQAANKMKARQWLASKLSHKFATRPPTEVGLVINGDVSLTDEQLMQIAAGGLPALEGESERVDEQVSTPVMAKDLSVVDGAGGFPVGEDEERPGVDEIVRGTDCGAGAEIDGREPGVDEHEGDTGSDGPSDPDPWDF